MLFSCASNIKKNFKAQTSDNFRQEKNLEHDLKNFL